MRSGALVRRSVILAVFYAAVDLAVRFSFMFLSSLVGLRGVVSAQIPALFGEGREYVLFAIGDLHLAIGEPDKTMEAFGGRWIGYVDKIRRGFDLLHEDDTCVICGDFCWAMSFAEALRIFNSSTVCPAKS